MEDENNEGTMEWLTNGFLEAYRQHLEMQLENKEQPSTIVEFFQMFFPNYRAKTKEQKWKN